MLEKSPFTHLIAPRLREAHSRLNGMIWSTAEEPLKVSATRPTETHGSLSSARRLTYQPITRTPVTWGPMFAQRFWKVNIPRARKNASGPRYLRWFDQAEATVYHDGKPIYGFDPGHAYCPIPQGATQLLIESTCCRTGIWVPGADVGTSPAGSVFRGAHLATRDEDAWHAFHDLDILLDTALLLDTRSGDPQQLTNAFGYREPLEACDPLLRVFVDRMDRAIDALDTGGPAAMRRAMKPIYRELSTADDHFRAILTGHAHVDLVWLWPERVGQFKTVHSFANALNVMRRYPEFTFGYSQPQAYAAAESRSPGLLADIKTQMQRGAWEATGAMYVESDTQLPCGEALIRSVELGQQGFESLRGVENPSRVLWLPDVFGYSGCIPTILAGFGVPYFFTTKMAWSSATRFPHSSFKWRGNDGSEVVAHLAWDHYNQEVRPREALNTMERHRQAAVHPEGLMPVGYGDGGGGPDDAMCERAARLKRLAGTPTVQWGGIESFFDRLAKRRVHLPAWHGEMYLEYHRGVQTTHADLKAAYRAAERALQTEEAAACVMGASFNATANTADWQRVVFSQFHDALPGSSIMAVCAELVGELNAITKQANQRVIESLTAKRKPTNRKTREPRAARAWLNPHALPVRHVIQDTPVLLPPLSCTAEKTLLTDHALAPIKPVRVGPVKGQTRRLTSDRVAITIDDEGRIVKLKFDGETVPLIAPAELRLFADHPVAWDAWDIDRQTLAASRTRHHGPATITVVDEDTACPGLRVVLPEDDTGAVTLTYRLPATGANHLSIDITADWQQPQRLMKFAVPTDYTGQSARFGAPFGSTLRPNRSDTIAEDARFEVPASRWASVSDDTESAGLALITDAKYGFGAVNGLLHVSLVRSAKTTERIVAKHEPTEAWADPQGAPHDPKLPAYSDLFEHQCRLVLAPHRANAPRDEQPAALADTLFTPPITIRAAALNKHPQHTAPGFIALHGAESTIPSWARPSINATNAWTLRLHETLGRRDTLQLELEDGYTATPVDLRGQPLSKPQPKFTVKPYQVISLLIAPTLATPIKQG